MVFRVFKSNLPAKPTFVLLRHFTTAICGYNEIDTNDGTGGSTWGTMVTGVNGSVLLAQPNTFTDSVASAFNLGHVGKYLVRELIKKFDDKHHDWEYIESYFDNTDENEISMDSLSEYLHSYESTHEGSFKIIY